MKRTIEYTVPQEYTGHKISEFLRSRGFSEQNLTTLRHTLGAIVLNDEVVFMNVRFDGENSLLRVNISDSKSSEKIPPVYADLDIVYEDEDMVVVNKPAGMPTHPSLNNYENTLANALAYYYKNQDDNFVFRCVNRLDKDTTGLTIIAKHMVSGSILYNEVVNRQIHRTYYAVVAGEDLSDSGTIDMPIAREREGVIKRCVDYERGQRAVTHYKVLRRGNGMTLAELNLETGRTHQIRVHMSTIGYPLIGDYMYNPAFEGMKSHQALHAGKLSFVHPITGQEISLSADFPKDMKELIKAME